MADIVTGTVTGQVDVSQLLAGQANIRREQAQIGSDVRREQAQIGSDVRRETAKEASDLTGVVKDGSWAGIDRTNSATDRIVAQDTAYFIAGQSQNFSNATALAALTASTNAASAEQLASAMLGQQIVADGNTTRALINSQKVDDLRNELLESKMHRKDECCDHGHRPYRQEPTFTYGPPVTSTYPV